MFDSSIKDFDKRRTEIEYIRHKSKCFTSALSEKTGSILKINNYGSSMACFAISLPRTA